MKKSHDLRGVTRLNGSAFTVGSCARGELEVLVTEALHRVLGGEDALSACTEFTCNLYAPPPPPQV